MNLNLPKFNALTDIELYLIRHGETDYNKKKIIQGRGINSSLNELGRWQAQAFFNQYKHIPFSSVYASSLQRTQQTVANFAQMGYEIKIHQELDEIDWGIYEGQIADDRTDGEFARLLKQWRNGYLHESFPGGESPLQLRERQLSFIENVLSYQQGKILICTHGRAIRSLLCIFTGTDPSLMDDFDHRNLALYRLKFTDNQCSVLSTNCIKHLDGQSKN